MPERAPSREIKQELDSAMRKIFEIIGFFKLEGNFPENQDKLLAVAVGGARDAFAEFPEGEAVDKKRLLGAIIDKTLDRLFPGQSAAMVPAKDELLDAAFLSDDRERIEKIREVLNNWGVRAEAVNDLSKYMSGVSKLAQVAKRELSPEEAQQVRQSLETARGGAMEWAKIMPLIVWYMIIIGLIYAIVLAIQEIEKNTKSKR